MKAKATITCPYCDYVFRRIPPDRTGCPNCQEIIYVYNSPLSNNKILLTEEGRIKIVRSRGVDPDRDYFTARMEELEASFAKAQASSSHYGELGRELESLVKGLLSEYLPNKYKIDTGFVRSLEKPGWRSNQIDILLSRGDICYPISVHQEFKVFPMESIISFLEVTSRLTKGKLREDYEKVADLQKLDKRVYSVPVFETSVSFDVKIGPQPRFYYFAFTTEIKEDNLKRILLELSNEYGVQLHALFVLKPSQCFLMPNAVPGDGKRNFETVSIETDRRKAVIAFLQHILTSLQTADFIPPNASIPFEHYFNPEFDLQEFSSVRRTVDNLPSNVPAYIGDAELAELKAPGGLMFRDRKEDRNPE